MTRKQFLTTLWKRYPVVPAGASRVGRIVEMVPTTGQKMSLILEREQRAESLTFEALGFVEDPKLDLISILRPGDLIAIENEAITLLAPRLAEMPKRSLQPKILALWQDYLRALHEFFRDEGFLQIATPTFVICPGTEPTLDPFETEFKMGSRREKLTLPTSPELHLKKALALGAEKIYEIRNCFRNSEITEHHQPEFTMIEWYRAYAGLNDIQNDVKKLVAYLGAKVPGLRSPKTVREASVAQLFQECCGFQLTPKTTAEELASLAKSLGIDVNSAQEIDDYYFLIFMEKIEFKFPPDEMTFVKDYPPYQAALARLSDAGWGERFEMYWQGLEIANAFHELNDPEIQKQRFAEDLAKKQRLGKEPICLDDEFMQSLEAGMPPASGIALGVERLFMALTGIQKISETRLFPLW